MTEPEEHERALVHAEERALIERASAMLIAGTVDGPLTITRLVELTGLKRWKVTLRDVDLKLAFQAAVGLDLPSATSSRAMEKSLATERAKSRALAADVQRLNSILERYAIVISELASDLAAARKQAEVRSIVQDIPRRPR